MESFRRIASEFSNSARQRRAVLFRRLFELTARTRILDLGSEAGTNIHNILKGTPVLPENVYIADISENLIRSGQKRFGYSPVVLKESGSLCFPDKFFDIVYCSSVIEHVTLPKEEVWGVTSGKMFRQAGFKRQQEFAGEIRRLGKGYFVQTPYRYFPIESHTWLPLVGFLPRVLLIPTLRLANRFWIKSTTPDWLLLDFRMISSLFPDDEVRAERFAGLVKSVIVVRTNRCDADAGRFSP